MPLHNWTEEKGWDGIHLLWIARLLQWIKPRLPEGYRAYVGSVPVLRLETQGKMVAALEPISPRHKDRPSARASYLARYLTYLREGAHLLLVDVLPRPRHFSFADVLARELQIAQPPTPAPLAITYRVGEPAPEGGRLIAIWRRPLQIGAPLPTMQLPLTVHASVPINLEETYMQAAADAYLT